MSVKKAAKKRGKKTAAKKTPATRGKRKSTPKAQGARLSDYFRQQRVSDLNATDEQVVANACEDGRKAFKWLRKQEEAGRSVKEILAASKKLRGSASHWFSSYISEACGDTIIDIIDERDGRFNEVSEAIDNLNGALSHLEDLDLNHVNPKVIRTVTAALQTEKDRLQAEYDAYNPDEVYKEVEVTLKRTTGGRLVLEASLPE